MSDPSPQGRQMWVDADPPSRDWPGPRRLSTRARLVLIATPLLVLVLLLGAVTALGGLDERTDSTLDVAPGTLVETGPLQLTFDRAEAYQQLDYSGDAESWTVTVHGTVRTVDTSSTRLSEAFVCADTRPGSQNVKTRVRLDNVQTYGPAAQPGLPLVPFSVDCIFDLSWTPGAPIYVGARRQEYRSTDPLGLSDQFGWQSRGGFYRVLMPYPITEPRPK